MPAQDAEHPQDAEHAQETPAARATPPVVPNSTPAEGPRSALQASPAQEIGRPTQASPTPKVGPPRETQPPADEPELLSLSLEELLKVRITSTGYFASSLQETPANTLVVDMAAIRRGPARSLQDVLHMYVPGTYMGFHPWSGALHGVRGILTDANTKTTVTLEGQHLNQRMGFGYMTGMTSPLMGDIDHIEITHGPGALTQGSGAINGFINMVPKHGTENPGTYFNFETGLKETAYVVELGHGLSYGEDKDLYLYAGTYDAEGFEPANVFEQETTSPVRAYGTGDPGYRVASYWRHQALGVNAFYFQNNPVTGSAVTGLAYAEGSWHTAAAGLRPRLDLELAPDHTLSLIGSLLLIDFGKKTPDPEGPVEAGGSEAHTDITAVYKATVIDHHSIAVGTSLGYKKFRERDQYLRGDLSSQVAAQDAAWIEFSVFAEDRWTIFEPLSLSLGLRYDKFLVDEISGEALPIPFKPDIAGHLSPQAALIYEIAPRTVAKVSYRHGYRVPDVVHYRFSSIGNRAAESLGLPTHHLVPETVDTYEANLQAELWSGLIVGINLFHNEFREQLSFGPLSDAWGDDADAVIAAGGNANGMIQNLADEEQSNGGELSGRWELTPRLTLDGSFSYADVGDLLPQRAPVGIVKAGISGHRVLGGVYFSFNYLSSSAMGQVGNPSSAQWHPAYKHQEHLVFLLLGYEVTDSFRVFVRAHNLFEEDRPVVTFTTNMPNRGYLGSDERRIYVGFQSEPW
ncbi:MAG: TonB-dependent receptor [Myxococcales bacterium]|nr:TonB-dependent receptor [Myxococcales bacterium]